MLVLNSMCVCVHVLIFEKNMRRLVVARLLGVLLGAPLPGASLTAPLQLVSVRQFLLKAESFVFCNYHKNCPSLGGRSGVNQVLGRC